MSNDRDTPRGAWRPAFDSRRLRAEPVVTRHAHAMATLLCDERLFEYLSESLPSRESLEADYEFLTDGRSPDGAEHWLTWILFLRGEQSPIGFVQATLPEPSGTGAFQLAYVIGARHWRRGYAREAVAALLDLVFARYAVKRAVAEMDTRNDASRRLVESLGFTRAATVFGAGTIRREPSHEYRYEMSRERWQARRNG